MNNKKNIFKTLRWNVFLPAFVLILLTISFAIINHDLFLIITTYAKNVMLSSFGGLFNIVGILCLILIAIAYFSPFGNVKIGGEKAQPLLEKHSCIFIILSTTIAAGILFWGTEEPIYHLAYPPVSLNIEPMSYEAAKFAMETMYLHWTFIPYAFYTIPTLVFSFTFYNMKQPISISSQMTPILLKFNKIKFSSIIDIILLFSICFAIASSFGTSVLNVSAGLNHIFGIENNKILWIMITIISSLTFIISAGSGLFKGIKYLSSLNIYVYLIILLIFIFLGPTFFILNSSIEAFGGFITNIFDKALFTGAYANDPWANNWTTFYWANWISWAPITAIFLSKLSYGYVIKEAIKINFLLPSIFSIIWMSILGGTTIYLQTNGLVDVLNIMNENGSGSGTYAVIEYFPFAKIIAVIYVFAVFISFITATDSTLNAMTSISSNEIMKEDEESPLAIKVLWGVVVSVVSLIFISSLGIDGIKMLSYLGGMPALLISIPCLISLYMIIKNFVDYDKTK